MCIVYYREDEACLCRESGSEGIGEEDAGTKGGAGQAKTGGLVKRKGTCL